MPASFTMGIGEVRTLTAKIQNGGANVNGILNWVSSNQGSCPISVKDEGTVTVSAIAAGTYTVTVALVGSGVTDTYTITVPALSPDTLALSYS